MNATAIVKAVRANGIELSLTSSGALKFKGPSGAVARWTPVLAANKPAILEELSWLEPVHVEEWEERAAHLVFDAGLPRAWAEPVARLLCSGPPGDYDLVRWQKVTDAILRFFDQWAATAYALSWQLEEIIGMDPVAPAARHDRKGLALLSERGSRVVAIDADGADIVTAQGVETTFLSQQKHPQPMKRKSRFCMTDTQTKRRGRAKGSSRKYGQNTGEIPLDGRFRPGNAGKPRGARHRTTQAVEALLDGEAEKLTRKAVGMALAGDVTALRLCFERICPPGRDRPVAVELPKIERTADTVTATAALVDAAASGVITPAEAVEMGKLIDVHARAIETVDLETRPSSLRWRSTPLTLPRCSSPRARRRGPRPCSSPTRIFSTLARSAHEALPLHQATATSSCCRSST
jgi:hypothetical protein